MDHCRRDEFAKLVAVRLNAAIRAPPMAVTYRVLFTPDVSSAELRRFIRRLGEWMAQQSVSGEDLPGADDHAIRDWVGGLPECDDETALIAGEQISISPGSFGPERSLKTVLHPRLFFDLRKADQSLLELFREFPLVSWERAEEG